MSTQRPLARAHMLRAIRTHTVRSSGRVSRRSLATPAHPPPAPKSVPPHSKDTQSYLRRLNERLPRFLRRYTTPLLGAPVTHVTSFLILHEITAIVPLFGLVAAFHYSAWMPDLRSESESGESSAFDQGVRRFGRWLGKKGWIEESDVKTVAEHEVTGITLREHAGVRLLLEFATAYAMTKALLPLRIAASAWATPWFARSVLTPTTNMARRLFSRN
ncbi:hypothetical protein N7539_000373 [Penicillium diatomitis]|uniref:Uncharacterized protein n=1 Tax=Penicillium diatomitis TaxID=2819901 RepID=A0A9W9XLJ5_9EURO|nr:uncharacterized protein N7539_000373 [Penicillium diatomitis]KAJ5495257.1 hypothetical protein N7539_000373 [Penicillium diatomitis]